ncbi:HTH-type transcriptional regulator CynR [compost metagenome]
MGAVGGHDVAGVTDDEQLAEVIQHTAMATILPEPIATAERALRRIPLLGEGPRRGAALLRRKNNYHSAAALAFMDLVPGTDFS